MHSQNGTTFVPVVGWEDVGVELRCGGGHVEGLTKRNLAPKDIVINEIDRTRFGIGLKRRCGAVGRAKRYGRGVLRMIRVLSRRDEREKKRGERRSLHITWSPAGKYEVRPQGLIVVAETRRNEWVLMCGDDKCEMRANTRIRFGKGV